ncbi:LysR family transcriptional regulator [Nesterenkonia populi]|uniref:LysR family transcriptional regulator n=1 Tax=Nesterenkonia populi TaxID=1591087 RepID=UPI0014783C8D|nr:LysR family transcriptional regulator [Nesterenkonia populi]
MEWDLRHAQCLAAIADEGTLTDAAIVLGISQAQASRRLRSLEAAWQVQLVRRLPRQAVLTEEGRRVLPQVRSLLQLAAATEQTARGAVQLRLGYVSTVAGRHTAQLQRLWRREHPGTDLVLLHGRAPTAGLGEGLVDAAVVRSVPEGSRFSLRELGREPLVVAVADDDVWADRESVRQEEFAGRPLVVSSVSDVPIARAWGEHAAPPPALTVDSTDSWLDAVAGGRGIGVTTTATAQQHRPEGLRYLPVEGEPCSDVSLLWPARGASALVGELADLLGGLFTR